MTRERSDHFGIAVARPHPQHLAADRAVVAQAVYSALKEALLSGEIAPGERLNLDEMCRRHQTSSTPMRHALARLEADGLVTRTAYRGYFAAPLIDARSLIELYELRRILEPAIAAKAAARASTASLEKLNLACDQAQALLSGADVPNIDELGLRDCDFHLGVAALTGNSRIVDHLTILMAPMARFSAYHRVHAAREAWDEHRAVVLALESGESDRAHDAMREHLRKGLHRSVQSPVP